MSSMGKNMSKAKLPDGWDYCTKYSIKRGNAKICKVNVGGRWIYELWINREHMETARTAQELIDKYKDRDLDNGLHKGLERSDSPAQANLMQLL
jgi:hypothetical protein